MVQSKNGIYIEIFVWKSNNAIEEAHKNSEVQKLWDEMAKVCDFTSLNSIEKAKEYFEQSVTVARELNKSGGYLLWDMTFLYLTAARTSCF